MNDKQVHRLIDFTSDGTMPTILLAMVDQYRTGEAATWGDGDWDGASGGEGIRAWETLNLTNLTSDPEPVRLRGKPALDIFLPVIFLPAFDVPMNFAKNMVGKNIRQIIFNGLQ